MAAFDWGLAFGSFTKTGALKKGQIPFHKPVMRGGVRSWPHGEEPSDASDYLDAHAYVRRQDRVSVDLDTMTLVSPKITAGDVERLARAEARRELRAAKRLLGGASMKGLAKALARARVREFVRAHPDIFYWRCEAHLRMRIDELKRRVRRAGTPGHRYHGRG